MSNLTPDMIEADAGKDFVKFNAVPVEIQAASEEKKLPTFDIVAYTGVPMNAGGFHSPVVVELSGVKAANDVVAIFRDHDPSRIVGQGKPVIDGNDIRVSGSVMSTNADAMEVVTLAQNGFKWQASIGASITRREFVEAGKKATVNGREIAGPVIVARESVLKEVSFVALGADSQTSAAVAASSPLERNQNMDERLKSWLQANGYQPESLTEQQFKPLEAAWRAETSAPKQSHSSVDSVLAQHRADATRREKIAELTASFLATNPGLNQDDITRIELLADNAITAKWTEERYELELLRAGRPQPISSIRATSRDNRLTNRVIEAAICMAGRLEGHEKQFKDEELQAAYDQFKSGIGLKQIFLMCAESRGFRSNYASDVTIDVQRHAFGMKGPDRIQASGFSTLDISSILANTANKFLRQGWDAVDMTPLRLAAIRNVRDFKQITTVSLTGDLMFEQLGAGGEIKHGTLGEVTYNNRADTYAKMLAVTRQDIINDDLSALTSVPMRLGRGSALKLNDIFWTAFLYGETAGFFSATHTDVGNTGNSNLNTGAADVTVAGLDATYTLFMNQVDPDGKPLGIMPRIMLVPTAQHAAALRLMNSEMLIDGTSTGLGGNANVWRGRFRVETSPYMHNTSYTGYSSTAWYLMADPQEIPAIEIAALNGRVEPVIETADADFNVLGVQMRGYSDVGVARQEFRAAVKADGGVS